MIIKNKHSKTKIALIALPVLLLVAGAVFLSTRPKKESDSITPKTDANVNFSPPTETEKKQADDNKTDIVNENSSSQPTTAPTTGKKVTPMISDASQYDARIEVRSYIPGIFEDGGSCIMTATKGARSVTKQTTGTKDATTTSCEVFLIPRSEFAEAGTWDVTVSYKSNTAQGASEPKKLEVK